MLHNSCSNLFNCQKLAFYSFAFQKKEHLISLPSGKISNLKFLSDRNSFLMALQNNVVLWSRAVWASVMVRFCEHIKFPTSTLESRGLKYQENVEAAGLLSACLLLVIDSLLCLRCIYVCVWSERREIITASLLHFKYLKRFYAVKHFCWGRRYQWLYINVITNFCFFLPLPVCSACWNSAHFFQLSVHLYSHPAFL